jgi:hypothetical protein
LNNTAFPSPAKISLNEVERIRRQHEVDFARGSVRYEGGILTDEVERLSACYVAGEIDSDELTAAVLISNTARS